MGEMTGNSRMYIGNVEHARANFREILEAVNEGEVEKVQRFINRCNLAGVEAAEIRPGLDFQNLLCAASQNRGSSPILSDRMQARKNKRRTDLSRNERKPVAEVKVTQKPVKVPARVINLSGLITGARNGA